MKATLDTNNPNNIIIDDGKHSINITINVTDKVETPPIVSPVLTPRAEQAATDVHPGVTAMVANDPNNLRKIGTVYYTLELSKQYKPEQASIAFASVVGYEPAAFISIFNTATESDRPDVCAGFIHEIHTALKTAGLPGIF